MLHAEQLLSQRQRFPIERLGLLMPTLFRKQVSELIQALGHFGALHAETLFPQRERLPIKRLGVVELAVIPGKVGAIKQSLAGITDSPS